MPTERMEEVEVVYLECEVCCVPYQGDEDECRTCGATAVRSDRFPVLPGSLTAARLRLADAAEAWLTTDHDGVGLLNLSRAHDALAALRTARGEG